MSNDERIAHRTPPGLAWGLVLVTLGLAACGTERDITGGEPDRPGVSLAALTIQVRLQPSDASIASALGWEDGVPGAEVNLLRSGTADWVRRRTDASGQARVVDLLPGLYRVYAGRFLTPGEASAAELPIRSFGDGVTTQIAERGEQSLELELASDLPGSLVVGEVGSWGPPTWETGGTYHNHHYFEVYNNSGHSLFLDGVVFGTTVRGQDSMTGFCAHSQSARSDMLGVYSFAMLAFPGAGGEYPIGAGETKLVAMSAIDHGVIHPDLPDLSAADFEIRAVRAADNPAVPNMLDVGLQPFVVGELGWWKIGYFVAERFNPRELPIMYRDLLGRDYVRVPRELLLDVVGRANVNADLEREHPACVPLLNRDFDRYEGGFPTTGRGFQDPLLSFMRRGLRNQGGRVILSDSNTSAVDFVLADPTPGVTLWPER